MASTVRTEVRGDQAFSRPGQASDHRARAARALLSWDVAVLTAVALLVRLIHLDHTVQVDELNHVFAARSLLENGTLQIGDDAGIYTRAWGFTYVVAAAFALLGESIVVARLPAVLAGTALVAVLFVWTRSVAGRAAAWVAALLLCFDPTALFLSQFTRFYTIHALLFLLGAIAVFSLCTRPASPRRRIGLALGALAAFGLAYHLQVTTVVGVAGVALGGCLLLIRREVIAVVGARWRWWLPALLLLSVPAAFVAARLLSLYIGAFRYADAWAGGSVDDPLYYLRMQLDWYPALWSLLPIVFLAAVYHRPRFTAFAGTVFLVAFSIHSLAAWKNPRFVFYATPFLFAFSGIAGAAALRWIGRQVMTACRRITWPVHGGRLARPAAAMALALTTGYLVAINSAYRLTAKMLTVDDADWTAPILYRGEPDWAAAAEALRSVADSSALIVSSSDLKALYYFGRLDVILSANELGSAFTMRPDFSISEKMKRPVIRQPESVARLIECSPSGLVLVEDKHLDQTWSVPPATTDYLRNHTEVVPLPAGLRLAAFRWRNPTHADIACPAGITPIPSS